MNELFCLTRFQGRSQGARSQPKFVILSEEPKNFVKYFVNHRTGYINQVRMPILKVYCSNKKNFIKEKIYPPLFKQILFNVMQLDVFGSNHNFELLFPDSTQTHPHVNHVTYTDLYRPYRIRPFSFSLSLSMCNVNVYYI